MNPFESMQSLAMLWGKTAGQAFADAQADHFKAWPSAGQGKRRAGACRPRLPNVQASRRRARPSRRRGPPPANSRPRSPTDCPAAETDRPSDPARGRDPRQDFRSARLALGHERARRGAPAAWPRARAWPTSGTPSASSGRCSSLGCPAPLQPRAQHRRPRRLDAGPPASSPSCSTTAPSMASRRSNPCANCLRSGARPRTALSSRCSVPSLSSRRSATL